jgi:hypothetical protein
MKTGHVLVLLGTLALPAIAPAAEVRTVHMASHSLFPPRAGTSQEKSAQDAGALKPRTHEVPSPVLVDYRASIDEAGKIQYTCKTAKPADFRAQAPASDRPEEQP